MNRNKNPLALWARGKGEWAIPCGTQMPRCQRVCQRGNASCAAFLRLSVKPNDTKHRRTGVYLDDMNSGQPTEHNLPAKRNSGPWLWIITISGLLVVLVAVLRREDTTLTGGAEITNQIRGTERPAPTFSPKRRMNSATAAVAQPSVEEVVAAKVVQFARSRRKLARELAAHFEVPMSDEMERFFDAAEAGRYEEMTSIYKSLRKQRESGTDGVNYGPQWRTIIETQGVADAAHDWPAQKLLDYGNGVLGSLRSEMIYVGGTDPGCFIPTLLNETSDGERRLIFTQNGLADNTYLDYVRFLYGERLAVPTPDDSQRAFQEYITDAQKRFVHDRDFPDEPKQLRPGEDVQVVDGKVQVSGQVAVMSINEKLFQMFLEKNPGASFAMEVSFPFASTYGDAGLLGPILEMRVQDGQQALTGERATQAVDYWRTMEQRLASDADSTDSLFSGFAYAKMASSQADFLLKRGYAAEAEETFRLANQIAPGSPESIFGLLNLLTNEGRIEDALRVAQEIQGRLPSEERLRPVLGEKPEIYTSLRGAIAELQRLQAAR
jgi:tetratricopeptide (TPR) repeat protein